ncbi:brachyurin-like [Cloeon dipterum]|uniref:brachyurin-like n=1 Tax=Cloeon dipterum TaxID=197152 RepID=UPI003220248A
MQALLFLLASLMLTAVSSEHNYFQLKRPNNLTALRPVYLNKTDDEWQKLTQANKPKPADPNAETIVQPPRAGKPSVFIQPHIVGGAVATLGQFPWHAIISHINVYSFGGSLILPEWVLTTASCTDNFYHIPSTNENYNVRLGTVTLESSPPGEYSVYTNVTYTHEGYNYTTFENNIALIKLPVPVTFSKTIMPIRLPPLSDATKDLTGLLATITGAGKVDGDSPYWGKFLKYTQVTVITYAECARFYGPDPLVGSTFCTKKNLTAPCSASLILTIRFKILKQNFSRIFIYSKMLVELWFTKISPILGFK